MHPYLRAIPAYISVDSSRSHPLRALPISPRGLRMKTRWLALVLLWRLWVPHIDPRSGMEELGLPPEQWISTDKLFETSRECWKQARLGGHPYGSQCRPEPYKRTE